MHTKETVIWGKWSDPSACGPQGFPQLKPQKPQLEKYSIEKLKVSLSRKKSFSIISNQEPKHDCILLYCYDQ